MQPRAGFTTPDPQLEDKGSASSLLPTGGGINVSTHSLRGLTKSALSQQVLMDSSISLYKQCESAWRVTKSSLDGSIDLDPPQPMALTGWIFWNLLFLSICLYVEDYVLSLFGVCE